MEASLEKINRRILYAAIGFAMGVIAPLFWIVIRLVFFANPDQSLWTQIISDITMDAKSLALYSYMGLGTGVMMALMGFYIGKATDKLALRAVELDSLHHEVSEKKEIFESRYKLLDNNVKHIH